MVITDLSKTQGPSLSTKFERERIENRKKAIRKILLTHRLGPKELAIIEPLFGCDDVKDQLEGAFEGLASFWNLRLRQDQGRVARRYKALYKQFGLKGLPKELAKRGEQMDSKIALLDKDLRRLRKQKGGKDTAEQQELTENLIRHLEGLSPRLKEIRDLVFTVYQLAQCWEQSEQKALSIRYNKDKGSYHYNPECTDGNIAYLLELKEEVADLGLAKLDSGLKALAEIGPGVLQVIDEVRKLQAQTKAGLERAQAAIEGKSLMAMDRIIATDHIHNLDQQTKAFAGMAKKAEKAAKMLRGKMKNFDLFVKNVGNLAKDLNVNRKALAKEKKQGDYITKVIRSLDAKAQKLNKAATGATRLWLLSTLLGKEAKELLKRLAEGNVKAVGAELESDSYFRAFSRVVSGGEASGVPKEGISIMVKDYPYQVRAFSRDLKRVYKSMHESNLLFLKQVSGASGKEDPDYIDNFENYLNARANTVTRFTDETAQNIISEVLPDVQEDEQEAWVKFLGKALVEEMMVSNASRKP